MIRTILRSDDLRQLAALLVKETLSLHMDAQRAKGAEFLFESSWKKPYSTRGVRALLARYAAKAGLEHNMPRTGCGTSCSPG